ncbi:MAG: type I DNA topoisomerase [Alphaproteobacteria bacterium]|jgi:DNA topoisomerase-1|nr:type I DNA topoisomerase [Alphaproteobacteria bacterium]
MDTNLVIVESPAKAKTIEKYLGPGWRVMASYGHVRDLVQKDGSVDPAAGFAMRWEVDPRASKTIAAIKSALKGADTLTLAPDPDREGEAIAWHVKEILDDAGALKGKKVQRVTFNAITKAAVQDAFAHPRALDAPLVEAYLARRALDYLVGFTLSPVLWRKLPGARSAGRVQSVALRAICEREAEIEAFTPREYWQIAADCHTAKGAPFTARLTHLAGNKLGKFDIPDEGAAQAAAARVEGKALAVQKVEAKEVRRSPAPPFITSTLQMEAARKLSMTAARTMRVAQSLYEAGLITYMRTDGTTLSPEAVDQAREVIEKDYGPTYLPKTPRLYKSKAKNAQEAHEAIRPTDLGKKAPTGLEADAARLYALIWKRAVASQMENARLEQTAVDISDGTDDVVLRATGQVLVFDGFLTLYHEDKDDEEDEDGRRLPPMAQGEGVKLLAVTPSQHFTQPPPRYTEASLVKRLEELGIGRPSTYASILQVLRDRDYVSMESRRFVPQDRGRIVTTFLTKFFGRYVDYGFTASLEEELDAIASGDVGWRDALGQFWDGFSRAVAGTKDLTITQVIDQLEADLADHLFPGGERACPKCGTGRLGLRLGKFGAFIGCSAYPECRYTRPLVAGEAEAAPRAEPRVLGACPATGREVSVRDGPYGPYVQMEADPDAPPPLTKSGKPSKAAPKPKRQGLPKGVEPASVTLDSALALLSLPRALGTHPDTGKEVTAGIGRFGPYLKHDGAFTSLPKDDDVLSVGMNRAVAVLAEAAKKPKRPPRGGGRGKRKGK